MGSNLCFWPDRDVSLIGDRDCLLTCISSLPGVPLKPMLAKICEGIPDALAQLKDKGATFLAEYKYDGQRAQIHLLPDGSVRALPIMSSPLPYL